MRSADGDEDLSDRTALHGSMGRCCVLEAVKVEWQAGLLPDAEGAVLDRVIDVGRGGGDLLPADRVEKDELVPGVEAHVASHVQAERRAAVVCIDRDRSARPEDGLVELCVRARSYLDDRVDAVRS